MRFSSWTNRLKLPPQAWHGATFGVIILTFILWLFSTTDLVNNDVTLGDASLYLLLGIIATAIIGIILVAICTSLVALPMAYKWALACFVFVIYYFFIPTQTLMGMSLIALWGLIAFSLTGGALWLLLSGISRNYTTWFSFLVGFCGIGLLTYWLFIDTSSFVPPTSISENKSTVIPIDLPNPALPGTFAINRLNYGKGIHPHRHHGPQASIETETVDGSSFIRGWDGIEGWLRTRYWGFDATQLPLNGHACYPLGEGPYPLVLIVHGNHEMSAPSDNGYEYLTSLWASRGFIAVSVDENFLNGSWIDFYYGLAESPARGWLLLEHLSLWRKWNQTEGHQFYKKVDMEKIALIGHSRGGEAIATAASLNQLSHHPDDGNILFDYHFNILGLGAIAPVEGQYLPGGQKIELNNIDYFVIQGSHDSDLRTFLGEAQYHRIQFTDKAYHFKSALYVVGANHGQFNTIWGKHDNAFPVIALFDTGQLLPGEQQRQIAQVYLTAFLEVCLHDNKGYLPLFHNYRNGQQWLPKTTYFNEFADSTYQYIAEDKNDIDISTTSLVGTHVEGKNLTIWRLSVITLKDGTQIDPAIFLGWDSTQPAPSYTITLPENVIKTSKSSILSLSIADSSDYQEASEQPIDFTIELIDRHGEKSSLPLSSYTYLVPSLYTNVMKASFLDPLSQTDHIFQTFEYPLSEFMKQNPQFDPDNIQSMSLIFNISSEGLIILDDVAIREDSIVLRKLK